MVRKCQLRGENMNASKPVLIAYYSLTGNTARVATDLAARLGADVESIQDKSHGVGVFGRIAAAIDALRKTSSKIGPLQHDPAEYAITVVATPVWVGQMTPAVRAYLKQTRGRIQNVAFFVTSGDTDIGKMAPALAASAGQSPVASAGFNARELADAATYENKLSAFVEEITSATRSTRRVA